MNKHVVIGLSGGVDSAVAAWLLQQEGYRVTGLLLQVPGAPSPYADVKRVADLLRIDLILHDVGDPFREKVIAPFVSAYLKGETPNPCLLCNPTIKFPVLLQAAERLGAEYIATGHYALLQQNPVTGRTELFRSPSKKDQSYVLSTLPQSILSRLLLPLGHLPKEEIRSLAAKIGLPVAEKKDSQEICFIPSGGHAAFIEAETGRKLEEGNFVDEQGNVLGRHKGVARYTLGQRKGLGLSLPSPLFVSGLDAEKNIVTLSPESSLFARTIRLTDLTFIPFDRPETDTLPLQAKPRSAAPPAPAVLDVSTGILTFDEPQRAPTPGQTCVLYDGDRVLGAGTIRKMP